MSAPRPSPPRLPAPDSRLRTLVIRPTRGWGRLELGDLWRYRELAWFLTWRNIKGKYRQMALGPLWILLQPLINTLIFSLVFGRLARMPSEGVPYPLFVYVAMLPWTYFAGALRESAGSLVSQMQVIAKVYFPRLVVPVAAVLTGVIDLVMSFVVLLGMMSYYGFNPGWRAVLLPGYVALAGAAALAVGLWTATLSVKYRDMRFAINFGTQIGMYATPVAYSAEVVAERLPDWMWLFRLNPMYWVVDGFRWALLGRGTGPDMDMAIPVAIVAVGLVSGAFVFRRTERTIVDLL